MSMHAATVYMHNYSDPTFLEIRVEVTADGFVSR